jgi:hypothetical protein
MSAGGRTWPAQQFRYFRRRPERDHSILRLDSTVKGRRRGDRDLEIFRQFQVYLPAQQQYVIFQLEHGNLGRKPGERIDECRRPLPFTLVLAQTAKTLIEVLGHLRAGARYGLRTQGGELTLEFFPSPIRKIHAELFRFYPSFWNHVS